MGSTLGFIVATALIFLYLSKTLSLYYTSECNTYFTVPLPAIGAAFQDYEGLIRCLSSGTFLVFQALLIAVMVSRRVLGPGAIRSRVGTMAAGNTAVVFDHFRYTTYEL